MQQLAVVYGAGYIFPSGKNNACYLPRCFFFLVMHFAAFSSYHFYYVCTRLKKLTCSCASRRSCVASIGVLSWSPADAAAAGAAATAGAAAAAAGAAAAVAAAGATGASVAAEGVPGVGARWRRDRRS